MSNYNIYRQGNLRAEIIKYSDGVGCCVWYPMESDGENEDMGIAFDFHAIDIDDFIKLLEKLKSVDPDIYDGEISSEDEDGE
jgi:hypothetical protein